MPFLHGFDFDFLTGFDDFAVSLYVKEFCGAVRHGKACLTHGAEERFGGADIANGNFLDGFRGGDCRFHVGLEHGGPAFGQKWDEVFACGYRDDERYGGATQDK